MTESISIIITCHNLEKYISLAIESVLKQDYLGSFEVMVIDDCSTDKSADIIKSFTNVRYLRSEKNLGVLMTTVLGLENTSGELVFFLDGDDIWEPSKLLVVVERFLANPLLALVTHDLKYIDSKGLTLDFTSKPEQVMSTITPSKESIAIRDGILLHSDYVWLGSAYAIHRTLGNVSGFCTFANNLSDPYNTYQDWPLAFWVACQPKVSFGYISQKLFQYRIHGTNYSGDSSTVSKALRNVRRTRNTMQAIKDITLQFNTNNDVQKITNRKLNFYTYLENLYSGQKWSATKGFIFSIPYLLLNNQLLAKEIIRFWCVQILGIEQFLKLTNLKNRIHHKPE